MSPTTLRYIRQVKAETMRDPIAFRKFQLELVTRMLALGHADVLNRYVNGAIESAGRGKLTTLAQLISTVEHM